MSVRKLSPELAEKARVELNEDPKNYEDDLKHMKEWLAKQPHIIARTDDQWLIAFLRSCKFSLERTKEKMDMFYTMRTTLPEFFRIKHRDQRFNEILDLHSYIILPKTATPTSPRTAIIRPGAYNPDEVHLIDILSISAVLQKIILMEDDNATVAGVQTILDLDNVTMGHFMHMTPSLMKKMVVSGQDAAPFRMKGTHYLNTPAGFETVFNAIKALLNEKNQSRLYVHNKNYEALYEHIPQDILPKEYGGTGGTIKEIVEYWKKKVEDYGPWLDEDLKYGTDESKRPGKPRTAEDLFGVEGSFRQLQVD